MRRKEREVGWVGRWDSGRNWGRGKNVIKIYCMGKILSNEIN